MHHSFTFFFTCEVPEKTASFRNLFLVDVLFHIKRNLFPIVFTATAYTSPIEALEFLEGHAQVVDLALVAVDMELMHGFQFLDIVREDHKNVQVISKC